MFDKILNRLVSINYYLILCVIISGIISVGLFFLYIWFIETFPIIFIIQCVVSVLIILYSWIYTITNFFHILHDKYFWGD